MNTLENQNRFTVTYSADRNEEVEAIRKKYLPQEKDKLEQLRELDASATKKANAVSIAVGVIGTLVMGTGMSLAMTDLGNNLGQGAFYLGIGVGMVGIAVLACAYPIYRRTLKKERERIRPEILRLSDELMK